MRRAVFLDRDGVLNRVVFRDLGGPEPVISSPRSIAEYELLPGAAEVVDRLRRAGFLVFVVTNQPDLARGLLTPAVSASISSHLSEVVGVDEVMVCPHDDVDDCLCRKPRAGMLLELAARWGVDLGSSYMVGDTWRDIEAGRAAGCRTVLVRWPYNEGVPADIVVAEIAAVADRLLLEG